MLIKEEELVAICTNEVLKEFKPHVLTMLRISRDKRISQPSFLFAFQHMVLGEIIKLEDNLKNLKKGTSNYIACKYLIRVFKWLMDGVALRLLRFDSNAYRVLSDSMNPGHIDPVGLLSELKTLEDNLRGGSPTVLNDLTNFLRIGDITVFRNGKVELIEVKNKASKMNKVNKELSKQEKKMKFSENMVNTNAFSQINLEEGKLQSGYVFASQANATTYLNKVKSIMKKAERDGWAYAEIDESLKIMAVGSLCDEKNIDIGSKIDEYLGFPEGHDVLIFKSLDLAHSGHGQIIRAAFPFTTLKLPCRMINKLLFGEVVLITVFSLTNYYKKFEAKGFKVVENFKVEKMIDKSGEILKNDAMPLEKSVPESHILVTKEGWRYQMPRVAEGRIAYEFIAPCSWVDLVEAEHEARSQAKMGQAFPIFRNHFNLYI